MHEWSRRYSRLTRDSPRILGFRRRKRARNVPRRLVLSQPFIDELPQKSVIDPSQIRDLHNELWPNPMNPRQHQRRPETGSPRRRDVERRRRRFQILAFSQTKGVAGRE
jgi:hypothetical protein